MKYITCPRPGWVMRGAVIEVTDAALSARTELGASVESEIIAANAVAARTAFKAC
jgi:hypothetical protein